MEGEAPRLRRAGSAGPPCRRHEWDGGTPHSLSLPPATPTEPRLRPTAPQADAASLYAYFADAGYNIMYKDVVNTVFLHKTVRCVGGD